MIRALLRINIVVVIIRALARFSITSHLGKKPKVGGNPPSERSIKRVGH